MDILALTSTLTSVQAPLPEKDVAVATASWTFVRSFGSIWGAAIPVAVFNFHIDTNLWRISDPALRELPARGGSYEHATRPPPMPAMIWKLTNSAVLLCWTEENKAEGTSTSTCHEDQVCREKGIARKVNLGQALGQRLIKVPKANVPMMILIKSSFAQRHHIRNNDVHHDKDIAIAESVDDARRNQHFYAASTTETTAQGKQCQAIMGYRRPKTSEALPAMG
ncbi:hypothetical protein DV735_g4646, partial [Chaetothyriales sp. CBS 134920]